MPRGRPMHKAICSSIVFSIATTKSPSFLMNRYKLGRLVSDTLYLTPFEAVYLFSKGRIKPENTYYASGINLMKELLPEEIDLILYSGYEHMKLKGYYVKREADSLFFRKSPRDEYQGPLRVMRESGHISFTDLQVLSGSLVATVDDENDLTFFSVDDANPVGSAETEYSSDVESEVVSDRHASMDETIPMWMGHRFNGVTFLTELEHCLFSPQEDQCRNDPLFRIYSDLIERHIIVKTGFKYGTNFRAYTTTMEDHADFLVHFLSGNDEWYKISRAVRVAHGVHKVMIFAGIVEDSVRYVSVERIKDPFFQGTDTKEQ